MRKINFVDTLFSNEGHYIDDIEKYSYLFEQYELHYFVNGKISNENKKRLEDTFVLHEIEEKKDFLAQIRYLLKIKKFLGKDDFNFIMSAKYLHLFIFSLLTRYFNYFLLVHFFPTVKKRINSYILNYLHKRIFGFMVLDTFVKEDLSQYLKSANKINIIHSRDINLKMLNKKETSKYKVSFIGAMNTYKDLTMLIEIITKYNYTNIEFGFYSKGINKHIKFSNFDNKVLIKDEYFSESEYQKYLKESDFIFLSYYDNYGIRFSGIVFDALNNGCQLICNDNPSFKYYINQYNCGYIFKTESELHDILNNIQKLDIKKNIYDDYSREKREKMFTNLLKDYFKDNNENN